METPAPQPQPTAPPTTPLPTEPPATPPSEAAPTAPAVPGQAELDVTVLGPLTAVVGSDVQFEIQVLNRGTAPATGVLVRDRFDVGLEHSAAKGAIEQNMTDLQPNQMSRLAVTFRVARAGELCQDITVTAGGDVRATTRRCLTASESLLGEPAVPPGETAPTTPGATPTPATARVTVTKKGPDRRKVGEMAVFTIEVTNPSDQHLRDLQIADNYEIVFKPSRATPGSEWLPGNALGWKIDVLEAGQTVRREVELECLRETPRACNRVQVSGPGMESVGDEACLEIVADEAEAPPAAQPATVTVSVAETADPIKVGGATTYQVVVTNSSQQSAFDVEVTVKFSDQLQLQEFSGPPGSGRGSSTASAVRFAAIRELRAGEAQTFELRYRGAKPGKAQVQVEVTSRDARAPATAEQTTEVLP